MVTPLTTDIAIIRKLLAATVDSMGRIIYLLGSKEIMMTPQALIATVVSEQRDALIRDEVRAGQSRERLETAIVQAIRRYGASIDEMSAASGLRPDEIHALLAEMPPASVDLASLTGMR